MKFAGRRLRSRVRGMAALTRATLFVVLTAALIFAIVQRRVLAQIDEAMLGLGSRVMMFPEEPSQETRTLEINGVSLHFRVQSVSAPIEELIRHYRRGCAGHAEGRGTFGPLIASLATRSRSDESEGYVACVDTGATDFATLVRRLTRFSKTWDVADAGLARYVYASRRSPNPASRTLLFAMWADGSLKLRDLLPLGEQDAKGVDPANVPRLPGSRRLLAARETGAPSRVYFYIAPRIPVADVMAFYKRELSIRGWSPVERRPQESRKIDGTAILTVRRAGRTIALLVRPSELERVLVAVLVTEAG